MLRDSRLRPLPLWAVALVLAAALLAGCGADTEPDPIDTVEAPENGVCRVLSPEDVAEPSNASPVVDCAEPHTAQTFAVGELPETHTDLDHDDPRLGSFAYRTCSKAFREFMKADESTVMRTMVSWAWFRPSPKAWDEGARWYRCDVIGGGEQSASYVDLPEDAAGMLEGLPDDTWMACVAGPSVPGAPRVACSEKHDWRAVTTIKIPADQDAPYPGDRLVEVKSRDFCSRSVAAWLKYPVKYDFAYTWFREAEWDAGNRRSVCWAKTTQ
ncbi:MAG TPA: septum formation family protein [Nocardioides sp.]|uniref:septum formation family protein n=1 Tax=Nocardioides sp. TaxID=35761 RepID=UPI002CAA2565|nr:septum formation family protein [Nocardioides sp.]HTW16997.1 septum formation family protein [Nocardioides sp.]